MGPGGSARIRRMQADSTSPPAEFPSGPIHHKTTLDNGLRVIGDVTIELEGSSRPACVAETISVVYPAAA